MFLHIVTQLYLGNILDQNKPMRIMVFKATDQSVDRIVLVQAVIVYALLSLSLLKDLEEEMAGFSEY